MVLLLAGLSGCQAPVPRDGGITELAPLDIDPAARRFSLPPGRSRLIVLAYRDGRLADLGHNHVISSEGLEGEVYLADKPRDSSFELRLPVATLEVDLPQNRRAAGPDFPGELDSEAVRGTRANMLGESQLDAGQWPEIVLRSRQVRGDWPNLTVQLEIAVRQHVHTLVLPVAVTLAGDRLTAAGHLQLRQTDLGIEPFSVLMGALKVRDELDIQFSIVAEADEPVR